MDRGARRASAAVAGAVLLGTAAGSVAPARADDARRVLTIIRRVVDLHAGKEVSRTTTAGNKIDINLSSDVLFGFGKAELSPGAQQTLKLAADQLGKAKGGTVHVDGYTDAKGSDGVNQPLSSQRAKAVADALGARVGSGFHFQVAGHGAADPRGPEHPPRRVRQPHGPSPEPPGGRQLPALSGRPSRPCSAATRRRAYAQPNSAAAGVIAHQPHVPVGEGRRSRRHR